MFVGGNLFYKKFTQKLCRELIFCKKLYIYIYKMGKPIVFIRISKKYLGVLVLFNKKIPWMSL